MARNEALRPMSRRATATAESADELYLAALGERIRDMRARRGMTRKVLARDSGVSERYLAQLESGQGNISILLLRQLSMALDTPLERVVRDGPEPSVELTHAAELLRRLGPAELRDAYRLLTETYGGTGVAQRRDRVALIGLRGAGKSTLGPVLAEQLGCPFVELDRAVESGAGAPLNEIFDLYGQAAFRRLERRSLQAIIDGHSKVVIATGGGIVSDPATFELLRSNCFVVWLRTSPAEHMERVIAQGDMRPMQHNREAMADLQQILKTREPLYSRADAQVDTSQKSLEASLEELLRAVR